MTCKCGLRFRRVTRSSLWQHTKFTQTQPSDSPLNYLFHQIFSPFFHFFLFTTHLCWALPTQYRHSATISVLLQEHWLRTSFIHLLPRSFRTVRLTTQLRCNATVLTSSYPTFTARAQSSPSLSSFASTHYLLVPPVWDSLYVAFKRPRYRPILRHDLDVRSIMSRHRPGQLTLDFRLPDFSRRTKRP